MAEQLQISSSALSSVKSGFAAASNSLGSVPPPPVGDLGPPSLVAAAEQASFNWAGALDGLELAANEGVLFVTTVDDEFSKTDNALSAQLGTGQ